MSCLRYYDESVLNYFSDIYVDDGVEEHRLVQALLAIPSRLGVKVELSEDNTPVFPMIVVTRSGMQPTNETFLLKGHITRPWFYNRVSDKKIYRGLEAMPYNLSYQIDMFSLFKETYNQLVEDILFKLYKRHSIRTQIDINGYSLMSNPYIKDVNYTDNTTYSKIEDTVNRIFHGTFTFNLFAMLFNDEWAQRSVLKVEYDINDDYTNPTSEVLIKNVNKQPQLNTEVDG
jgi:hypothetical protein